MSAGKNPGFIGRAGGIGAESGEVSAHLDEALPGVHLLGQNVAKNATLLLFEVIQPRAQFI